MANYGDPVRDVANVTDHNRVANILNDIQGVGCRIEKPVNGNGRGWKIIVGDGSSDIDTTDLDPDFLPPDYRRIKKILDAMGGSSGDPINKTFSALSTSASFDELLDDSEDYRGRVIECDVKQIPAGDSAELASPNWRTYIVKAAPASDVDLAADSPYTVYVNSDDGALRIKASSADVDYAVAWVRASARFASPCGCPTGLDTEYFVTLSYSMEVWLNTDCSGAPSNTGTGNVSLVVEYVSDCTFEGTDVDGNVVRVGLNTSTCQWYVAWYNSLWPNQYGINKPVGNTPMGTYPDYDSGCVEYMDYSERCELTGIVVTEVTP